MTQNKAISHSINRDGQIVPANGFKQPTPTISMHNPSNIWMHSIERSDAANPVQGFIIFGVLLLTMGLILIFVR